MYTNCRSSSLLEWKIIADQEAENYLLQSFLKKVGSGEPRNSNHEPVSSQANGTRAAHTTKATRYVEENKIDSPEEEMLEKHDKATDRRQIDGAKEQDPLQKKDTQPKSNTRQPEMKTMTSEDIMSMLARGDIAQREV